MGRCGSRRKINLGGEWEIENETLPAQEIAKQLNNYEESVAKETDRARQLRIDELSLQQERNPTTESRLLTQIQDLQNSANSLSDTREFCDPETASTRTLPCRDSGLPHDTRNIMGTSGNVFESLPDKAQKDQQSSSPRLRRFKVLPKCSSKDSGKKQDRGRVLVLREEESSSFPNVARSRRTATVESRKVPDTIATFKAARVNKKEFKGKWATSVARLVTCHQALQIQRNQCIRSWRRQLDRFLTGSRSITGHEIFIDLDTALEIGALVQLPEDHRAFTIGIDSCAAVSCVPEATCRGLTTRCSTRQARRRVFQETFLQAAAGFGCAKSDRSISKTGLSGT